MNRAREAWISFALSRSAGVALDVAALAAAYVAAFLLRFDFTEPRWGWGTVAASFATVCAVQLAALAACGCYRMSWRRTRLRDLPWYAIASVLACATMTALRFSTPIETYMRLRPPYSVTVVFAVLSFASTVGWRLMWTWAASFSSGEEDLLERTVRRMDPAPAIGLLRGKTVMVTGAGGSIGSEIVRQVALAAPRRILLVERCENALYEIDRELRESGAGSPFVPLMVDVSDEEAMEGIFSEHRPEIVLHAAAYKHVPMVEMNPREGERNNTLATKRLAEMSKRHGVARFVLISTDKAVNPVSVMGRTKLAAERAVMALNEDGGTSFCAVRFGNVFGSSGSVVELFRRQIAARMPVTVTHPDMRRYFMTVSEAVGLVLQAASRTERAIYTLDMGEPVRILDLAEHMIRQAGYKPYVDIPIRFTGIRPGERLFEELDVSGKSAYKTDMARIYVTKT